MGTILAIFDLQVTQMLPPSFKSSGLSIQEKKEKYIFKMAAMVAILNFHRNNFSDFLSTSHPDASFLPILKSIGLSFQEKKQKINFKASRHLGFPISSSGSHFV